MFPLAGAVSVNVLPSPLQADCGFLWNVRLLVTVKEAALVGNSFLQLPLCLLFQGSAVALQAWVLGAGFMPGPGGGDGVLLRLVGQQVELT